MNPLSPVNFLTNLKPGDDVIVIKRLHTEGRALRKVARVTKTQIIIVEGTYFNGDPRELKFNRESGGQIGGDSWSRAYLEEATSEIKAEIIAHHTKMKLLERVKKVNWNKLDIVQLEQVLAIVPESASSS